MPDTARSRLRPLRSVASSLALVVLAAACTGSPSEDGASVPVESATAAASDGGTDPAGDGTGASDGGGQATAAVPQEAFAVTPAPEGFTPPDPCSGEGAYFTELGGTATPDLPERAGESLTVELVGIDGDHAELRATIGDSPAREIEAMTLGETVTVDLWTLSVTSVCEDSEQVEFDLID
ncbi:hypothetical protein [Brachybacterium saurashtrense]|uniref:Lipoprotein n=1 Tax=Brachybacterium saurashtrense TaxID=556288 RepID=A0A345YSP7_9MICO|nr:hypothetical protein [Brachybacterium saurashtrense]AXK46949.1 hypothetical protein DWV08_15860 [Brachybacterium saurashtrense]RRR22664.1 hypothetical protein DXU92_10480 [Brachybacterium saurashtrense]